MTEMSRIRLAPDYEISRVIRGGWQLAAGHGEARSLDPIADLVARTDGALADVAFDAAAVPAVAAMLPDAVRPGGTIALVGVHAAPVAVDLVAVVFRELSLVGNRVYDPDDIEAAIGLIAAGDIDPSRLITAVVPVDDTPEALRRLRAGDGIKYLIDTGSVP